MDELAEAAEVSRRTLFNYFPGKLDAVLGPGPELGNSHLETFQAGGPTGEFLQDTKVLISELVEVKGFDRAEAEATRRIFRSEEHTSELQSLIRISYALFCFKKRKSTSLNSTQ